ncbi:MAG: hypothetical protein ACKO6B_13690 [Planctomycetia bacterium]
MFTRRLTSDSPGTATTVLVCLVCVCLIWSCMAAGQARAELTIDRIEPGGGPRGGDLEIVLTGKEFADPEQLWFEEGSIEVVSLTGVNATQAKATIRIPADCRLGNHRLRLRTKRGLSELRTFRVGSLPPGVAQRPEQEPNNEPGAAGVTGQPPLSPAAPCTISGVVKGEDIDCFPIRAAAGERIAVAIDAIRLDQEMFDPCVEIVDERGFVLASCDDHPLLGQDAMLAATAPADGTYLLRVRESAYGGNDGCVYLLHVGRFPVPHLAWPPGGAPGAELEVEWLGDPAGPFRSKIVLPREGDLSGLAEVRPERDGVVSPVGVPVRISTIPPAAETEPNNEPGKAVQVSAPANIIGRMDAADDVDWIRVEAPKGSSWRIRGRGRRLGSPIDLVVNIHRDDEKREKIAGNDDTDGPDSDVRIKTPDQGSFLLRINDHQRRGGPNFVYWIDVEPAEPGVTVSVPPARSNTQERLVAAVPRGNRTALVFNTARTDCDETVQLAFDGLPAGVEVITPPAIGKAPGTIAVFQAAADAAASTGLAQVAVRAVAAGDAAPRQLGGLRQVTELVMGQPNNASYRTSTTDRLPIAVVEPARIRIDVEEPAAPIVRRGRMDLRVRIVREGEFAGKVRLTLPFRPPGINAPPNVEVGEKDTEATYTINASPDAPIGDWQLVVLATAMDKDEPSVWVSSLPVTVRVAEPLIELASEKAVAEPGQEARVVCKITKPGSFMGTATVKLMGLPAKAAAPELEFAATATELVFPVAVAADAQPGRHDNVFCEVRVPMAGTWVVHAMPGNQLRIDKPLPKPEPTPEPKTKPEPTDNAATEKKAGT